MEHVIVSVDDDQLEDMSSVVDALRRAGLTVTEVLHGVGAVVGTVDSDAMGSLSAVPGVAEVGTNQHFQLPPPNHPLQ